MTLEASALIADLIDAARKNVASDWEERFVADLGERYEKYAERIYLSPKQRTILCRIADLVPRFEPLNGKPDHDSYVHPEPTTPSCVAYDAMCEQLAVDLGDIAIAHPTAPDAVLRTMIRIATDHGWRFAPDKPTDNMKQAWVDYGGANPTQTHADMVYREMMQKAPRFAATDEAVQ